MSFPTYVDLKYGDEKVIGTTKLHPFGMRGITPDGREFRYCRAGATYPLLATYGCCGNLDFVHSGTAAAASGYGTYTVTITAEADIVADEFAEGYLCVTSGTEKYPMYRIKSHPAASNTATCVMTLWEPLIYGKTGTVAIDTAQTVTLFRNPYNGMLSPRGEITATGGCAYAEGTEIFVGYLGVPTRKITVDNYGWIQIKGPCLLSGGSNMGQSTAEIDCYFYGDGSVRVYGTAVYSGYQKCGFSMPKTYWGGVGYDQSGATILVFLQLD